MIRDFLAWVFAYQKGSAEALDTAAEALSGQKAVLLAAGETLNEWQKLALESQRSCRDLAIAFRTYCDLPDADIREDLDELVRDLKDAVAILEERIR